MGSNCSHPSLIPAECNARPWGYLLILITKKTCHHFREALSKAAKRTPPILSSRKSDFVED